MASSSSAAGSADPSRQAAHDPKLVDLLRQSATLLVQQQTYIMQLEALLESTDRFWPEPVAAALQELLKRNNLSLHPSADEIRNHLENNPALGSRGKAHLIDRHLTKYREKMRKELRSEVLRNHPEIADDIAAELKRRVIEGNQKCYDAIDDIVNADNADGALLRNKLMQQVALVNEMGEKKTPKLPRLQDPKSNATLVKFVKQTHSCPKSKGDVAQPADADPDANHLPLPTVPEL